LIAWVKGLLRHVGLSNATAAQIGEARRIVRIVCVQSMSSVAHRADDALIDDLAHEGSRLAPFFPLGVSRRCSHQPRPALPCASAPSRYRLRLPGCWAAHPTSCWSPALRPSRICAKTWRGAELDLPDDAAAGLDGITAGVGAW